MKAFFLTRQLREKALLLVLVLGAVAFWLPKLIAANKELAASRQKVTNDLADQQKDLDREPVVFARQKEVTALLDPEKSYDKNRLLAEIVKVAGNAGIATNSINYATSRTANSRQMSIITQRITISNVDMGGLVSFYRELAKKAPYITIVQCGITASRGGRAGGAAGGFTTTTGAGARGGDTAGPTGGGGPGGRGARGATVGQLEPTTLASTRGSGVAVSPTPARPAGPAGSTLNVTLDLTAISLKNPNAPAAPAATPARATPAARATSAAPATRATPPA